MKWRIGMIGQVEHPHPNKHSLHFMCHSNPLNMRPNPYIYSPEPVTKSLRNVTNVILLMLEQPHYADYAMLLVA